MIAFDARSIYSGGTGDRVYFANLITALAKLVPDERLTLYYHLPDPVRDALGDAAPNIRLAHVPARSGFLWPHLNLPARLRRDGAALLHAQYTLPIVPFCPTVVTIADVSFRVDRSWFPPKQHAIMNTLIPLAARGANQIITQSEFSKREIVERLQVDPQKVAAIPLAVSPGFQPMDLGVAVRLAMERYGLSGPFLIGVGLQGGSRQYRRKNARIVVRAVERLKASGDWPKNAVVALTGRSEQFGSDDEVRSADFVRFLGYVPDDDLPLLYGSAAACVYPSRYEGFGLPPLEALASGCPVVASNAASIPEVVGDCGLLCGPDDLEGWADALRRSLTEDLRAIFGQAGIDRAAKLTWEKTAQNTLDVYASVLGRSI
ncbi:MAG: glycosyltransferase family 1 protein [Capsulimonadaceae bacterium]|nr:glycosyltransferase family 1 protein [Capsulimonadaceae bacterium]